MHGTVHTVYNTYESLCGAVTLTIQLNIPICLSFVMSNDSLFKSDISTRVGCLKGLGVFNRVEGVYSRATQ